MAYDDDDELHPFRRRGFKAAAAFLGVFAIFGGVFVVMNIVRGHDESASPATATTVTAPSSAPEESVPAEVVAGTDFVSVCGLPGDASTEPPAAAPAAEWVFVGTTAYPSSLEYGPGTVSADGVRSCFQHSPVGAVFAAANAVVQGSQTGYTGEWLDYFVAESPGREALLAQSTAGMDSTGVRLAIAGFRVLSYDGTDALVDVAVRGSGGTEGKSATLSMVYRLRWEAGDWKLVVTNALTPIDVAAISNLSTYISWGV